MDRLLFLIPNACLPCILTSTCSWTYAFLSAFQVSFLLNDNIDKTLVVAGLKKTTTKKTVKSPWWKTNLIRDRRFLNTTFSEIFPSYFRANEWLKKHSSSKTTLAVLLGWSYERNSTVWKGTKNKKNFLPSYWKACQFSVIPIVSVNSTNDGNW